MRSTAAPSSADVAALLNARAGVLVDSGDCRGVAAGVIVGRENHTRTYGPIDTNAVFQVASLTKVFVALALAQMSLRGELALDDPVATLLPAHVTVPSAGGKQVTLLQLVTHTSGLPRMPPAMMETLDISEDPYGGFGVRELYRALGATRVHTVGEFVNYSNLGFGLLGHAMSLRAGTSLHVLLKRLVFEPLGMRESAVKPSARQVARLVQGHSEQGWPVPPWRFGSLAAFGAVHSTLADLATFAGHVLRPRSSPLGAALALTLRRRAPFSGTPGSWMGMGWVLVSTGGRDVAWHNGGTYGMSSFLGVDRARHTAVALLANSASVGLTTQGHRILSSLAENRAI